MNCREISNSEWQTLRLDDLGTITGGGTPPTKVSAYWDGGIPWLTPSEVGKSSGMYVSSSARTISLSGLDKCGASLLPPGSVLMTSRATIGEVAINTVPIATNQGFINVICNPNVVLPEYLAFWIRLNRPTFVSRAAGSTFLEISKSSFRTVRISLPTIEEQQLIVQALATVRTALERRQNELALERERKAALMHHLFTHGTRGEPTKQTEIGEMPESWRTVQLGDVAEVAYGLTVNETRRNSPDTAPYLTVANVTRGALRLEEVKTIGMLSGDPVNYRLQGGDVLFVEGSGNPKLLGSAAVWNDELPFALHQNHLIRARPYQSVALPVWIMSYFNSDAGREQLLGKATTSSGLHNVNSRLIAGLQLPLPPLPDQLAIVAAYEHCDAYIRALAQELRALGDLFDAMLESLMTGHMTNPGPL